MAFPGAPEIVPSTNAEHLGAAAAESAVQCLGSLDDVGTAVSRLIGTTITVRKTTYDVPENLRMPLALIANAVQAQVGFLQGQLKQLKEAQTQLVQLATIAKDGYTEAGAQRKRVDAAEAEHIETLKRQLAKRDAEIEALKKENDALKAKCNPICSNQDCRRHATLPKKPLCWPCLNAARTARGGAGGDDGAGTKNDGASANPSGQNP